MVINPIQFLLYIKVQVGLCWVTLSWGFVRFGCFQYISNFLQWTEKPVDATMPPLSHGALWFHGRSGWHENDLAGEVKGCRVRAWLRYRAPVTHKETGERSCHSLSTDHSTEPQPSPLWQISQHHSLHLQGPESGQVTQIWINIRLLTLRWEKLWIELAAFLFEQKICSYWPLTYRPS